MSIVEAGPLAAVRAAALSEHYQRTAELVSRFWERRNRQFIVLTGVLAMAVLVAFSRQLIAPFLEALIVGRLPGLKPDVVERLGAFLPLASDLLLALLAVTIFYLMASLCHGSGLIINYYVYLSMLEREIRCELQLSRSQVAFTREGPFFDVTGSKLTRLIGVCYKSVLGLLLLAFFGLRIYFDLPVGGGPAPGPEDAVQWYGRIVRSALLAVDVVVAIPTLLLFVRYARLSGMPEDKVRQRLAELLD